MTAAPSQDTAKDTAKPVKSGPAHEMVELFKTIVYALMIALVLRVIFFQPFTIPSASMEPTLLEGDYIIVSKFAYGWSRHSAPFSPPLFKGRIFGHEPTRGDIIVFKLPRDGHTDYIKRVIGLPGDKIQVKQGQVFINGAPIKRQAMSSERVENAFGLPHDVLRFRETLPTGKTYITYSFGPDSEAENTDVYEVPKGNYFMMGDNRDNSVDSRFPTDIGVGFVPAENLVGRADIILFSWKMSASLFKPWTWVTDIRPSRFGHSLK
jgi:signal peptidase I